MNRMIGTLAVEAAGGPVPIPSPPPIVVSVAFASVCDYVLVVPQLGTVSASRKFVQTRWYISGSLDL